MDTNDVFTKETRSTSGIHVKIENGKVDCILLETRTYFFFKLSRVFTSSKYRSSEKLKKGEPRHRAQAGKS